MPNRLRRLLAVESATATRTRGEQVRESTPAGTSIATTDAKSGRLQIGLITPGWGSSGYYSAKVLENAAAAKIFPAGTQMFLDHPGEAESYDRPERSVRDLAAVLTTDAVWDGQRLVGEAQVFGPYLPLLTDAEFAKTIGVSIRAYAEATTGEAEGRKGPIITELLEGESVDFVTRAGRGGSILAVLESARPERVTERAITAGVAEATANDTREALANALREAYPGDQSWVWVRDFDATTVWYEHETPSWAGVFAEAYTQDATSGAVTLAGVRTEVRATTVYVPVTPTPATESSQSGGSSGAPNVPAPAGQSTTPQESEEDTMPQIEEARLRQLEEDAGRAREAVAREAQLARENAVLRARESARPIAAEVLAASESLPAPVRERVITESLAAVTVGEDLAFNADGFRETVEAARTQAEAEVAAIAESLGAGRVSGFGRSAASTTVAESGGAAIPTWESIDAHLDVTKEA